MAVLNSYSVLSQNMSQLYNIFIFIFFIYVYRKEGETCYVQYSGLKLKNKRQNSIFKL